MKQSVVHFVSLFMSHAPDYSDADTISSSIELRLRLRARALGALDRFEPSRREGDGSSTAGRAGAVLRIARSKELRRD